MPIRFTRPVDKDVRAWMNAVQGAGATVGGPQQGYVQALVTKLKASAVWPSLDRLHVAGENFTQFNTCLVSRNTGVNSVTPPTYTANLGIAGNGLTSYWDSRFNTSLGTNFKQNSGHFSVFQNVAGSLGKEGQHGNVNTDAGVNGTYVKFLPGAGAADSRLNSATSTVNTVVAGVGMLMPNRTSSTSAPLWYNGVKGADPTANSQTRQNLTLWIGGRNFNGSINGPSDATVMAMSVGAGLTDAHAAALYSALLAYKTSIGA